MPVRSVGRLVLDRCVDNFFAETEQVAFCTQNIVPGHRFQQRSAAAGPQLLLSRYPAQAAGRPELHPSSDQRAEMPVPHFQQDGHMAMRQSRRAAPITSRTPGAARTAARANRPTSASVSFAGRGNGPQGARARRKPSPTITARRGSSTSARPPIEQTPHRARRSSSSSAKSNRVEIRARMVSHLRNIDGDLAKTVADGLRLQRVPEAATPARPVRDDLKPSPALSIVDNGAATSRAARSARW